ncbi:MAG TPA: type II toxin-antitoxin system HicB family antitoxin [Terracidiphilus sp.]|jgi:predicted RNase H-like HicB family nuclease|nr:type II toxin-antitoxin system HicB family antitoxin [Terracidiphilus sp.]
MTREYMVVFERGSGNWSAFSPDVPGCGSLGDSLDEVRENMREALELYLSESAKAGEDLPVPSAKSVDFEEFDPGHQTKHYVVEWLSIRMPQPVSETQAA